MVGKQACGCQFDPDFVALEHSAHEPHHTLLHPPIPLPVVPKPGALNEESEPGTSGMFVGKVLGKLKKKDK